METFEEKFTHSATEHLQNIYLPRTKPAQIRRIILYHMINASADSGYQIDRVTIIDDDLQRIGRMHVLINSTLRVDLEIIKEKKEVFNGK